MGAPRITNEATEAAAHSLRQFDAEGQSEPGELGLLLAYRDAARAALEAAVPLLAPQSDGLRASIEEMTTDIDGNEYEHVDGCEGEDTCPACWVADIRYRLAANLAPQPVDEVAAEEPVVWRCAHCGDRIGQFDDDLAWRSQEDFGGTGTGAYTEALWCTEAPGHDHSPRLAPELTSPTQLDREAVWDILDREINGNPGDFDRATDAVLALLNGGAK